MREIPAHGRPTKDDLIIACLRFVDARYRDRLRGGLAANSSATERVLRIFDSLRDWFATPNFRGCAFVNAFSVSAVVPSLRQDWGTGTAGAV